MLEDTPYKKEEPEEESLKEIGRGLVTLSRSRAIRAKLLQARDLLDSGKITYTVNGKYYEIDFKMPTEHQVTLDSDNLFTNEDKSDPIQIIRSHKRKIVESPCTSG